ncbi:unnamed protein product [marine sediment metagenome]|uniref:Uncharacterized protein n=1 Tax=marine sediment metagenome TaxID=412755 RepID=X1B5A2_9ZZZZ
MKMHIYHCASVKFKDVMPKGQKRKPSDLIRWPNELGKVDIVFRPLQNDLKKENSTKDLIRLFEHIDLMDTANSPIRLRRTWISEKLGVDKSKLSIMLSKLYDMRLLKNLTIEYDYRKWLQHSRTKGCLVVMIGIENPDYERSRLATLAFNEIKRAYFNLLHSGEKRPKLNPNNIRIKHIYIIPNAHISSDIGLDHKQNLKFLNDIASKLNKYGLPTTLNSYGYPKEIELVIMGHQQEYVLRCI